MAGKKRDDKKDGGQPSGSLLTEVPDADILSRQDFRLLGRAFAAIEDGRALAAPLISAIEDLVILDRTGLGAVGGSVHAGEVAALFSDFEPWPAGLGSNRPAFAKVPPVLTLRSPGAPLIAAYLAVGDPEAGRTMVGRAITAFLWRAEPVVRVVLAARLFGDGQLTPDQFGAVATFAGKILFKPLDPKTLVSALRGGPTALPFPWPVDFDPGPPRKPPFSAYLAPENQAWLHCAMGIHQLVPPLPSVPKHSPPPGLVAPAAICPGAIPLGGLEVTFSSVGVGFGAQGNWGISVNGAPVTILNWTSKQIKVLVDNLAPGCNHFSWTYATNWAFDDNGVGAACGEALRLPIVDLAAGVHALLKEHTRFWTPPGEITVIAPAVQRFEASDGTGGAMARACSPVTLNWAINQLPCAAFSGLVTVRLYRDGVQIAPSTPAPLNSTLPMVGSYSDTRELAATYRIEATGRDASGQLCGTTYRDITIARVPKSITLSVPTEVRAAMPVMATITISCPAPAGGVVVQLASTPADGLVIPVSVTIPADAVTTTVQFAAGTACGTAHVTATATDHAAAAADICVILAPKITLFAPPATLRSCVTNSLSLTADCVSPALTAVAIASDGTRTRLSVSPPAAGGGCVHSAAVTLTAPALAPGSYQVEITDKGGSATATASFVLAPNPIVIRATPTSVTFNAQCNPAVIKVTARAAGADSVTFTYTDVAMATVTETVMRPAGSSALCSEWAAEFSNAFDRNGSIAIVPTFGTVAGPTLTVPVTIGNATAAFSSVILHGVASPGGRPQAALSRTEEPCDGSTPPASNPPSPGSLADQATATFPLAAKMFTVFTATWPKYSEAGESSTTTSALFGHPDGSSVTIDV